MSDYWREIGKRMNGMARAGEYASEYIIELWGDFDYGESGKYVEQPQLTTLNAALAWAKENIGYPGADENMLVWEVLWSGHRRVIWALACWHELNVPVTQFYPGDEGEGETERTDEQWENWSP